MKPRICEILNLNVGQPFRLEPNGQKYYISELGYIHSCIDNAAVCGIAESAINHPDQIIRDTMLSDGDKGWIRALHLILPDAAEITCRDIEDSDFDDLENADYVEILDKDKEARLILTRNELHGYFADLHIGASIQIKDVLRFCDLE